MHKILIASLVCLPLLGGCSASVTTYSGSFESQGREDARLRCDAQITGTATTNQVTIGSGVDTRVYHERMRLCLERYGYAP